MMVAVKRGSFAVGTLIPWPDSYVNRSILKICFAFINAAIVRRLTWGTNVFRLAPMIVISVQEILVELRALGVPEADFLKISGIHQRTWDRLKKGEFRARQDTAERIAHAMRVLRAEHFGKPARGDPDDGPVDKDCAPVEAL